mgnify:CR=1 FL=1
MATKNKKGGKIRWFLINLHILNSISMFPWFYEQTRGKPTQNPSGLVTENNRNKSCYITTRISFP